MDKKQFAGLLAGIHQMGRYMCGQPVAGARDNQPGNDEMSVKYRNATSNDIAECIDVRGKTRENAISVERLKQIGVTHASWSSDVASGKLPGYVCIDESRIVGYCFGDKHSGEIVVLALLPQWEGRGIGKKLLNMVVTDFMALGHRRLFLGCAPDPKVRSYGFYRYLGWKSTGTFDAHRDEILEYFPDASTRVRI